MTDRAKHEAREKLLKAAVLVVSDRVDERADDPGWGAERRDAMFEEAAREYAKHLHPPFHIYEQRADGWSIEHPLACRDTGLLNCDYHKLAAKYVQPPVSPPGRYRLFIGPGRHLCFQAAQ